VAWPERLSITLSEAEGEFLHQLIAASQPDSLLGKIMLDDTALREFLALCEDASFSDLADLPFVRNLADRRLRQIVRLADLFWNLLFGAHVRYNCLLQERFGTEARGREYLREWSEWRTRMRTFPWKEWDSTAMWDIIAMSDTHIKPHTRHFIDGWIDLAERLPSDISKFDSCVTSQEWANKRTRARLRPENSDAQVKGWIGIRTLNYRLPQAWRIVSDIYRAENGEADASVGL
jgi:hypothetical protein